LEEQGFFLNLAMGVMKIFKMSVNKGLLKFLIRTNLPESKVINWGKKTLSGEKLYRIFIPGRSYFDFSLKEKKFILYSDDLINDIRKISFNYTKTVGIHPKNFLDYEVLS